MINVLITLHIYIYTRVTHVSKVRYLIYLCLPVKVLYFYRGKQHLINIKATLSRTYTICVWWCVGGDVESVMNMVSCMTMQHETGDAQDLRDIVSLVAG